LQIGEKDANWGFEMGDLSGWTSTGSAFDDQPTKGDNPRARNAEVSNMAGTYWIGTFEAYDGVSGAPGDTGGESKVGTLTSEEFMIEKDTINFLIGGGSDEHTEYVELLV